MILMPSGILPDRDREFLMIRDLYINGDAEFKAAGVGINQNDNFHFLAVSTFVVPETGNYQFQMTQKDDRAAAYFDLNKNNAIESTGNLHGTNPNRNWDSGLLSLTAGDKHLFGAGMMEGGGVHVVIV